MRIHPVPALYDERPREIGGILTLKQAGYLGAGAVLALLALGGLPGVVAMPAVVLSLLAGAALAFGRVQGIPVDRAAILAADYLRRPRLAAWRRGAVD